ncbi:flavin reductase family protein [Altererythrobacter confluentis]|uniref:Flavin reductase family protein n=1 Tax=Allopontixanthobacter confluentis TaxID=1849021 RepID=A0A6L7GIR6_9SPHN|nr:flavin reductase family protein [Allopontixanthobacter confluentis]MXP15450.1 flavin reductase family protein [Allopontixanthobacter confluentis]
MQFDMSKLDAAERYKLLVNTITPRPIAWVVTQDAAGNRNAAPYSFFNAMGSDPALVAIFMGPDDVRSPSGQKDSLRAIRETGEFTVALVSEDDAPKMVRSATDAPAGVDELALLDIPTRPASMVTPPLIASAPVTYECRLWQFIETTANAGIVLGEVVAMDIDDRLLGEENGRLRIDAPAMKLVGRAHGAGWYWRGSDQLRIDRQNWPLDQT